MISSGISNSSHLNVSRVTGIAVLEVIVDLDEEIQD